MSELEGKVALVTGGTRGIGRACAAALASEGVRVALCGRNPDTAASAADELAQETSGELRGFGCDIADPDAVSGMVKAVGESLGPITILVNNAGITRDGLLMRMKDDDWSAVLQTNLTGTFHCCRAVARDMVKQRWGRIINISSIIGVRGQGGQTNYAAAKAGIIGFSKSLAQELGSRNITVNVVAPGYIETDMTAALPENLRDAIVKRVTLGRTGTCEDVSGVVRFLASDAAAYITGAVIQVDGGLAM